MKKQIDQIELPFNSKYVLKSDGTLISKMRGERVLKQVSNNFGYKQYFLTDGITYKWYKIHRLVATYFIDNPNNYKEVNHLDNNKSNNDHTNLQWCTHSQNIKHGYDSGHRKYKPRIHKKPTESTKLKMSEAKKGSKHPKFKGYYCFNNLVFESINEAERLTNINKRTISRHTNANINGWSYSQTL